MAKIKRLSKQVVAKIAAGEVIERPCFVVKELIENAIDAKSKQIDIEITNAGLDSIIITDNGYGMSKDDLVLSIEPHTTSKISTIEDLVYVKTLGFRGEALASIASISNIVIETKRKSDNTGYKLTNNNDVIQVKPIGHKNGTKVIINQLFDNVPIRKKFLKSRRTEFKRILDIVSDYILSTSNIGFTLTNNNKEVFSIYPSHTLEEKIEKILGETVNDNLITISQKTPFFTVSGFLGHPQLSFSTSNKLFIFVNGRRVINQLIISAIKDAYENLLEPAMYPMGILFFDIHPEIIDVNIHPRKEDVKFSIPEHIYTEIYKCVLNTLKNKNLTFGNISWKKSEVGSYAGILLKDEISKIQDYSSSEIIQIQKTYLITETAKGVAFFDQHAVHEAILFRKLKQSFEDKITKNEIIKIDAILISLSKSEQEILWDNLETLKNIGYSFDDFGDGTPILTTTPKLLMDRNHTEILQEILESISLSKLPKKIDHKSYRMLSYIACRSAIKAGQILSPEERKNLIEQLREEDYVYTCPHGRPVKLEITLNQLHRQFKRK